MSLKWIAVLGICLLAAQVSALSGEKRLLTEEDLRTTTNWFQGEQRQKQGPVVKVAADDNKKAEDDFLAQNKTKEGIVTLPSGLQYRILKAGSGKKPAETDMVEVTYRGTLINGTEFDSSYSRGQPATFRINRAVIPAWAEALRLMPVGSRWQLFVPSKLAYGERGAGRDVGPNTMLIFEVELIAIK